MFSYRELLGASRAAARPVASSTIAISACGCRRANHRYLLLFQRTIRPGPCVMSGGEACASAHEPVPNFGRDAEVIASGRRPAGSSCPDTLTRLDRKSIFDSPSIDRTDI
jgi:hypothetical protein